MVGGIFIFIQISIEHSVSKQWRPWPDAAFCGAWPGSALYAYVPQKGRDTFMGVLVCFLSWGSVLCRLRSGYMMCFNAFLPNGISQFCSGLVHDNFNGC